MISGRLYVAALPAQWQRREETSEMVVAETRTKLFIHYKPLRCYLWPELHTEVRCGVLNGSQWAAGFNVHRLLRGFKLQTVEEIIHHTSRF